MERSTVIGLDIGQRRDPTALAIVEAVETRTGRSSTSATSRGGALRRPQLLPGDRGPVLRP